MPLSLSLTFLLPIVCLQMPEPPDTTPPAVKTAADAPITDAEKIACRPRAERRRAGRRECRDGDRGGPVAVEDIAAVRSALAATR